MKRRQGRPADEVSLVSGGIYWSRLPARTRTALVASVSTLKRVRERLRTSVLVQTLPPIRLIPAIWMNPNHTGSVDGRSTVVQVGQDFMFGVELPAQTALAGSEGTIEAVLIHEFGHCFHFSKEVIDHVDSGGGPELPMTRDTNIYEDEAADRACLVDPRDWFTPEVAQDFPYWNDPRIHIPFDAAWLDQFPVEDGARQFVSNRIAIPEDVIAHIRKLRASQR